MPLDPPISKPGNDFGQTDFAKIMSSGPLPTGQGIPNNNSFREKDPNQERREDRVKRENLLRYYDAEYTHSKRELDVVNGILKELENKIRAEEKEVEILKNEEIELRKKLDRTVKSLHRFQFELRVHKGEQMEKRIVQRRWAESVKDSEAKLKKIKYGDWRQLRK